MSGGSLGTNDFEGSNDRNGRHETLNNSGSRTGLSIGPVSSEGIYEKKTFAVLTHPAR